MATPEQDTDCRNAFHAMVGHILDIRRGSDGRYYDSQTQHEWITARAMWHDGFNTGAADVRACNDYEPRG